MSFPADRGVDDGQLDNAVLDYFRTESTRFVTADSMTNAQRVAQAMRSNLAAAERVDRGKPKRIAD